MQRYSAAYMHMHPMSQQPASISLNQRPSLITIPKFITVAPTRGIEHHITTKEPPVYGYPRRIAPDKFLVTKKEFNEMLKMAIICPFSSSWSSQLHMVSKKFGAWHPCGDYCVLNERTNPDRYPVPHIQDFGSQLRGKTILQKLI